jgi:flagellar biosynthesis/type III secretory pathway protein FliH
MSFVTVARQRGSAFVQAVLAQDAAQLAAQEAELARRVRQEVGKLRAETLAAARAAAQAEAAAAAAPVAARLDQALAVLNAALGQLAAPLAAREVELAALATELGFTVGRHLAGVELAGAPAGVQALVARLLAEAAGARGAQARLVLRVSPADAPALAGHAVAATLVEDAGIAPGGVLLELLDSEGEAAPLACWDATLGGRIAQLRAALGLPEDAP